MAACGTARTYARQAGQDDLAGLLQAALKEKEKAVNRQVRLEALVKRPGAFPTITRPALMPPLLGSP